MSLTFILQEEEVSGIEGVVGRLLVLQESTFSPVFSWSKSVHIIMVNFFVSPSPSSMKDTVQFLTTHSYMINTWVHWLHGHLATYRLYRAELRVAIIIFVQFFHCTSYRE